MTREEAINEIKEKIDTYITCHGEEDTVAVSLDNVDVEALDMAIKALEQEFCGNAISRQAVLEYIEGSEAELRHSSENELVRQYIKELPSVTPIRPKGHWIEVLGGCKCSHCDMAFSKLKETCADNYCPNCGSDNREVEE